MGAYLGDSDVVIGGSSDHSGSVLNAKDNRVVVFRDSCADPINSYKRKQRQIVAKI